MQGILIWYEPANFPGYGLAALQATTDVTSATVVFQNDFEACGTCDQSQRVAFAENVLSAFGNDMVDGGGSGDAGSPCTVPGHGVGACMTIAQCAATPGHVTTPGYCQGSTEVQCCTATSTGGDDGGSDGGLPPDDGGPVSPGGADSGGNADIWPRTGHSLGCSTAPCGAGGSPTGLWLVGLATIAIGRRRPRWGCRASPP